MRQEAALHLCKARDFLDQMQGLDPERMAETLVHQAYYAMFHAAISVLLFQGEEAPVRHAMVVGRFGQKVKGMDDHARLMGRAFNRAHDLRLAADYAVGSKVLAESAKGLAEDAKRFVAFCEGLCR
ncbi:MAG: HEPN domain-containing protein [Alphaproteobacteria bacterium]|nr:HEPN domain-containing protein [Alphaproteobacteria bacterium]